MKVFPKFPKEAECPICWTNKDTESWLVPIDDTDTDGNTEAIPVHVECTGQRLVNRMRYNRSIGIIYYFVER